MEPFSLRTIESGRIPATCWRRPAATGTGKDSNVICPMSLTPIALSLAILAGLGPAVSADAERAGQDEYSAYTFGEEPVDFPLDEIESLAAPSLGAEVELDAGAAGVTGIGDEFSDGERSSGWIRVDDVFPLFSGDPSLNGLPPVSDERTDFGAYLFVDYDAFRGVPDGGWENNGLRTGFNFATRLGRLSDLTGLGLQIGASVGAYDWAGTDYRLQNQTRVQTQGFFTYGLYRRPTENSRTVVALVQDWSFNDTFSVFGENPTLSQLRGQLGFALNASNEFGMWGAVHVAGSTLQVPFFGPTTYQSVDHLSGYWHHKWHVYGPETWISAGVPSRSRLEGSGSLGDYLVSATAICPFSDAVGLFSSVTYMHQSASPGPAAASDDAWNFSVGISIYPRRNARTTTVAGERWMPLLPVANNGSFLVDISQHY